MLTEIYACCQVQPELSEEDKALFYNMYITGPYIVLALQLILSIVGTSLLFHTARLLYWNWVYSGQQGMEFQLSEDEKKMAIIDVDMPMMNKVFGSGEKHRI